MFGHESLPSRVYAYGARAPVGNAELVRDQLHLARQYRNAIVEVERGRRDAANEVIREYYPRLLELDAEIEALDQQVADLRAAQKRDNVRARRRDPDPQRAATIREMLARIKALRAEHKALRVQSYGQKGKPEADPPVPEIPGDPAVRAALDGLEATTRERLKALRSEYSALIGWGTRNSVESGLRSIRSGPPPSFAGRNWSGKLAVQLQVDRGRGIESPTWDDLVHGRRSHASQVRIEPTPLPPNATPGGRRSKRPVWLLHMRIASEGRGPVWATIPFTLHRPIPADGRIKWIYLVHRRVATHDEWSVQFVVARETWNRADTVTAAGVAAVNLGWRTLDDGSLRVAYAVGGDGHREELVLPADDLSRWTHADSLQSIRDREFELVRAALVRWLATADVPDWMREATETLPQWRSEARLAGLVIRWRGERFDGDADIFERVEAWRKQDKHLYDWLAAQRAKAMRWRDDLYRRFAARLRWRYERIVLDDTDWKALRKKKPAESETEPEALNTRRRAAIASPGRLREIIEHGHPQTERLSAARITQTCHYCGVADEDLDRSQRSVRCRACGEQADQDLRAAHNLLRAASGDVVHA